MTTMIAAGEAGETGAAGAGAAAITGELAALAARLSASVVEVRTEGHGAGAGTIWSAGGIIVTNHHVAPVEEVHVTLSDGRMFPARAVARDRDNDLVALRIEARGLPAVTAGDARALKAGDLVLALGHPFGVRASLTLGIVTAALPRQPGPGERELIRASVLLGPGNSGGPLLDARGRVAGINAMVAGGLALAVPGHLVERLVGVQRRPRRLGIQGRDVELPAAFAAAAGLAGRNAVLVAAMEEDAPAARAGMIVGDLLVALDRRPLDGVESLLRALSAGTAETLRLGILRGGEPRELVAVFEGDPADTSVSGSSKEDEERHAA